MKSTAAISRSVRTYRDSLALSEADGGDGIVDLTCRAVRSPRGRANLALLISASVVMLSFIRAK